MKTLAFASQPPDKRIDRKKLHSSKDIVFITIAAGVPKFRNISSVYGSKPFAVKNPNW